MKQYAPLLSLLLLFCGCRQATSPAVETDSLWVLTDYTIPVGKKGAVIGEISGTETGTFRLLRDQAGKFRIIDGNKIVLKEEAEVGREDPYRYEIEIGCGNHSKKFELVKDDFIRNGVIAHRGAWKHYEVSQNSMGSLRKGIELGCEGVEFDVWLSQDGEIILSHDPEIGGRPVEHSTFAELREVVLEGDEQVPSLREYLEQIKTQNRTRLVLEVKSSQLSKERSVGLAEKAVRMVHELCAQAWVEYISFNYDVLLKIRELDRTAAISLLEGYKTLEELQSDRVTGIDYYFTAFLEDTTFIDRAHAMGFTTNAWTVNDAEAMEKLRDMGIRYITTDEPELLLQQIP